jgi:hypothetical protein
MDMGQAVAEVEVDHRVRDLDLVFAVPMKIHGLVSVLAVPFLPSLAPDDVLELHADVQDHMQHSDEFAFWSFQTLSIDKGRKSTHDMIRVP